MSQVESCFRCNFCYQIKVIKDLVVAVVVVCGVVYVFNVCVCGGAGEITLVHYLSCPIVLEF